MRLLKQILLIALFAFIVPAGKAYAFPADDNDWIPIHSVSTRLMAPRIIGMFSHLNRCVNPEYRIF